MMTPATWLLLLVLGFASGVYTGVIFKRTLDRKKKEEMQRSIEKKRRLARLAQKQVLLQRIARRQKEISMPPEMRGKTRDTQS